MDAYVVKIAEIATSKHAKKNVKKVTYGTAGLRGKATDLDFVVYRLGVLSAFRSKYKNATIGAVITASHNPEPDNGVKMVDPLGEMMEAKWEIYANQLATWSDNELAAGLKQLVETVGITVEKKAHVVLARDTRPSSPQLAQAFIDGVEAAGATYKNYGLLTTPQLHYMVRCINTNEAYGKPTEDAYNEKFTTAFKKLIAKVPSSHTDCVPSLVLDGANGVGANKMKVINDLLSDNLVISVCNDGAGTLNHQCGADYVKTNQCAPAGVTLEPGLRCASFDGDADRVVYYYGDKDNKFNLLDGDKIATLVAGYLTGLLTASTLPLTLGLVQTAYANGSSTNYITSEMKIPVACTPTGVKYLHHKAQDFDIGVYFEANGHGTVIFSDKAMAMIHNAESKEVLDSDQNEAIAQLQLITDIVNQAVGDAISDVLLVEVILRSKNWSAADWNKCYTDLPNRMSKVVVKDRTVISTTDAERQALTPAGLQDGINTLVAKYKHGRSFVRPSGTEDIVRVYAEADTQEQCDLLAHEVATLVYELAGGVGNKPEL